MQSSSLSCISKLQDPSITELTPTSKAWHVAFSNNTGELLASSHGIPNPCVRIWKYNSDTKEYKLASTLEGVHERTIRYSSFNSTNSLLASASFDGTISIWESCYEEGGVTDVIDWECIAQLEGHENEVKCVVWNSSDTLLASCGRDKSVWIWECFLNDAVAGGGGGDGDFDCLAVLHGHNGDVKCISFALSHNQWGDRNSDDILISASYDDTIKIWAEDDGDWYCASTLPNVHTSTVWCISLTSSSLRLVSASDDCSLAFWKFYTASELEHPNPNPSPNPNPNPNPNKEGVWKCVKQLKNIHSSAIYSVHCSSATLGHGCIASCSADNTIQIYRELTTTTRTTTAEGEQPPQFVVNAVANVHEDCCSTATTCGDINCVQWHPRNSTLLASASDDGIIRLWKYS